MEKFTVVDPTNEAELSRRLRAQRMTGAVLELTIRREQSNYDESQHARFYVETIFTNRPTSLTGSVFFLRDKSEGYGRIDADDGLDDTNNGLTLSVEKY